MLLPTDVGAYHDTQGRLPEHLAERQGPCQGIKARPLAQDHEVPRLLVARRRRLHPRRQDLPNLVVSDRFARVGAHAAPRHQGFKRIHLHVPHSFGFRMIGDLNRA